MPANRQQVSRVKIDTGNATDASKITDCNVTTEWAKNRTVLCLFSYSGQWPFFSRDQYPLTEQKGE